MSGLFVKAANALFSGSSFLLSSLSGNPIIYGMPATVSVELGNHCNLKCPECINGSGQMKRERGFMDIALFEKIIAELEPYLFNINLYFQGEPMMHPDFFSFLDHSGSTHSVVSTNGHFLSVNNAIRLVKSGLNKLIVSLDGLDQAVYSGYRRNGDFEKVMEGIRSVSAERDRYGSLMKLEIQFLVNKHNEHQISEAQEFAREVKANLKLKSMQVLNIRDAGRWMPASRKFRRYERNDGNYTVRNSLPDRCLRAWLNPVVTWDGKVIPCCFDKNAEFVMGDLNESSFEEIWNNKVYREFRQMILSGRKYVPICRNCTSGMKGIRI
jgi:radical SAM protein with 4Fe4S-binding SPASM domain